MIGIKRHGRKRLPRNEGSGVETHWQYLQANDKRFGTCGVARPAQVWDDQSSFVDLLLRTFVNMIVENVRSNSSIS